MSNIPNRQENSTQSSLQNGGLQDSPSLGESSPETRQRAMEPSSQARVSTRGQTSSSTLRSGARREQAQDQSSIIRSRLNPNLNQPSNVQTSHASLPPTESRTSVLPNLPVSSPSFSGPRLPTSVVGTTPRPSPVFVEGNLSSNLRSPPVFIEGNLSSNLRSPPVFLERNLPANLRSPPVSLGENLSSNLHSPPVSTEGALSSNLHPSPVLTEGNVAVNAHQPAPNLPSTSPAHFLLHQWRLLGVIIP